MRTTVSLSVWDQVTWRTEHMAYLRESIRDPHAGGQAQNEVLARYRELRALITSPFAEEYKA